MRRATAALAALTALAACGSSPASTTAAPSSTAAPSASSPTSPGPARSTTVPSAPSLAVEPKPCTAGGYAARCATADVPADRGNPASGTVSVRVVIVPSKDGNGASVAPLVLLSGGPGGSAVDDLPAFVDKLGAVRDDRDLVLVEQRGTGPSALRCAPLPLALRDPAALTAAGAQWAQRCLASAADKGLDVRTLGTDTFVDDLDDILGRLGYGPVDVYGGSYGALAAQVLAVRHPQRIRSLALDGVSLLGVPIIANMPVNSQRAVDAIVARCATDAACHAAFPDLPRDLTSVLAKLRAQPAPTSLVDEAIAAPLVLDDVLAAQAIHGLALYTETAPALPIVVHAAALGVTGPLENVAKQVQAATADSRLAMYATIRCNEAWARHDRANDAASYLQQADLLQDAFFEGVCRAWPTVPLPAAEAQPPHTNAPVLLMIGGTDAQNPPSATDGATGAMPNAVALTIEHAGHGILQQPCARDVLHRMLQTGTTANLDTSCARSVTPPPFVTSA